MQLSDRGGQVVSRPSPNPTISPGWANNDLTQTTAPTIGDPDWANAVSAELIAFLSQTGLTASKTNVTQVLQAVMRIAGGNITTVTAATQTLTADNAGLVLVNATSNDVAITLPASASASGQMLKFRFMRTDSTTNTVSIAFSSGDTTLIGGVSGPLSLSPLAPLALVGDGTAHWVVVPSPGFVAISSVGTTNWVVPAGVTWVIADVTGGGGGSGSCASGQGAGGGGAGGCSIKGCTVTPGQTITVTIGAGGAAGVAGNGGTGGTSSFGSFCSATGGGAGIQSGPSNSAGGTPGVGSGGDFDGAGGFGSDGQTYSGLSFGGNGGASRWGGGGRGASGGGAALTGSAPGSGAGGPYNSASNGGAGAPGIIFLWWP